MDSQPRRRCLVSIFTALGYEGRGYAVVMARMMLVVTADDDETILKCVAKAEAGGIVQY